MYYLAGYAGTGKTFTVVHILNDLGLCRRDVMQATLMARSAFVLARASGLPGQTIHSLIYNREELANGEARWVLNQNSILREKKLLVLDECSMVGAKLFRDLLYFNRPILLLGDPGQFAPVMDDPYVSLLTPNFELTEIRRQAEGSPIIRLATMARRGQYIAPGTYQDDANGVVRKVSYEEAMQGSEFWTEGNIAITPWNNMRRHLNQMFRKTLGYEHRSIWPIKGEKLICLRNDPTESLHNGMLGLASADASPPNAKSPLWMDINFKSYETEGNLSVVNYRSLSAEFDPSGVLEAQTSKDDLDRKPKFAFGYVVTGHKALGSQFDRVVVHDPDRVFMQQMANYNKYMYVSITRAQTGCTIITDSRIFPMKGPLGDYDLGRARREMTSSRKKG